MWVLVAIWRRYRDTEIQIQKCRNAEILRYRDTDIQIYSQAPGAGAWLYSRVQEIWGLVVILTGGRDNLYKVSNYLAQQQKNQPAHISCSSKKNSIFNKTAYVQSKHFTKALII